MTYLSRVEINPRRIETMRALSSPEIIHAAVMSSFPPLSGECRPLWRVDKVGESTYILVQSGTKPDFTHIVQQFGWPASDQGWDSIDYEGFLSKVKKGGTYMFRLRANPVRSVWDGVKGSRGKVCNHITAEQQIKWLENKSLLCGFTVAGDDLSVAVVRREVLRFKNKRNDVTISAATFEGVLRVTDREVFIQSLLGGIGRAKSYGCGMMSIVQQRDA